MLSSVNRNTGLLCVLYIVGVLVKYGNGEMEAAIGHNNAFDEDVDSGRGGLYEDNDITQKRGGGRAFIEAAANKRGGARPFAAEMMDTSADKRGGGRAFQLKRGGGRSFAGADKRGGGRAFVEPAWKRGGGRGFNFGGGGGGGGDYLGSMYKRAGGRAFYGGNSGGYSFGSPYVSDFPLIYQKKALPTGYMPYYLSEEYKRAGARPFLADQL